LAIVLVRGRVITTAFSAGGAVSQDRAPFRVPPELAERAIVARRPWWLGGGALAIGVLAPLLPYFRTQGHRFELALVLVYAVVAVSLTVLIGWGGQVSLGQFAIVGLGAFVAARLSPHGWSLPLILCAGGACGGAAMVVIGLPALRLRGFALAVTTLGFAVLAPDWLLRQRWLGSAQPFGIAVKPPQVAVGLGRPTSELGVYYVALVVLTLVVLAVRAIRASGPGRLAIAVRDNERAAASFTITPTTVKLSVLALSGVIAAMGGVLWAQAWQTASANQFPAELNFAVLAAPVIGGLGSAGGAVAGAAVLYLSTYFVSPLLTGVFGSFGHQLGFQLAVGGAGLVAVLLAYPAGLAGAADQLWERFTAHLAEAYRVREDRSSEAPLVVEDVRTTFGGVVALDGVTINVRAGEIVGLIGPNGAGKTTLMNVISGTAVPDSGAVWLIGRDVTRLPADVRSAFGLARSFQDASLFAGLTVTETVQVALAPAHRTGFVSALFGAPWARSTERRSRQRAAQIIERLGLGEWAGSLTADLSTGTRRICDIAAQVAAAPKLLLLDEPTAGVSQRDAEAFGPLLRGVRDELDCSILIVEHDMPLLMGLCDRIYAMEAGRVIAEGGPAEIRADKAVVASYLGTDAVALSRSGSRAPGVTVKGVSGRSRTGARNGARPGPTTYPRERRMP
ncbi:MAG: branched-chain amino acid ABC transporter ATP-binding protein/permease, partial [Acidimicrobiales bacterium]